MKGIREIKDRIKAVKSTEQITRAMQLVAASKMKRAQDQAKVKRPYSLLIAQILNSLIEYSEDLQHPLLTRREEVKHRGILVVATDKGLCGPLNTNLFRMLSSVEPSTRFVTIGRKATQYFSRSKRDLIADFTVSDHCHFSEVRAILEFMINAYIEGRIDTLEVAFPRFENTLVQTPTLRSILPLSDIRQELIALHKRLNPNEALPTKDEREMLFEPAGKEILSELINLYVKQEIYQTILEAKASEHSARMVAMKTATENAKDLVRSLKLEYNKARQAAITQEILELAAAASSLQ